MGGCVGPALSTEATAGNRHSRSNSSIAQTVISCVISHIVYVPAVTDLPQPLIRVCCPPLLGQDALDRQPAYLCCPDLRRRRTSRRREWRGSRSRPSVLIPLD